MSHSTLGTPLRSTTGSPSPSSPRLSSRRRPRPRRRGRRLVAVLAVALAALGTLVAVSPAANAVPGGDRFLAGRIYRGEFGAPSIMLIGRTYYAYATNLDGHKLPVMTSTDLQTWRARPAYAEPLPRFTDGWKGYNDAFPWPARWAAYYQGGGGRTTSIWAPSVMHIQDHYELAYTVLVNNATQKRCISIATARHPMGPFHDDSSGPIVCSRDPLGSIDPQLFQAAGGHVYLVWKNAGVPGGRPTQIWTRRLDDSGTSFARPSMQHFLLQTRRPSWEGNVIEAQAMTRFGGKYYLFFSGNIYSGSNYAEGYALCDGPMGPCREITRHPLLSTGGPIAGPGAAAPFFDKHGRLRLAYSAWSRGHVGYAASDACRRSSGGCNQRRLHIATVRMGRANRLWIEHTG